MLFASGAAMVTRARRFARSGDSTSGTSCSSRTSTSAGGYWLLGYRVRYVPARSSTTATTRSVRRARARREEFLLERNALFTIYKNYDDANLERSLAAAVLLAVRRGAVLGGDDNRLLDPRRRLQATASGNDDRCPVDGRTLAPAYAIDAFVEELPELAAGPARAPGARVAAPTTRSRALFRLPMFPNIGDPTFLEASPRPSTPSGSIGSSRRRRRIVVATGDVLEPKMAGPAIRAWHIAMRPRTRARRPARRARRTASLTHPDFPVRAVDDRELAELEAWCDVVIFQGYLLRQHPVLRDTDEDRRRRHLRPVPPRGARAGPRSRPCRAPAGRAVVDRRPQPAAATGRLLPLREREAAGLLARAAGGGRSHQPGRPTTTTRTSTGSSRSSPFGVTDEPPRAHPTGRSRASSPGIDADDKVMLWGGGIYNWFDPLTLVPRGRPARAPPSRRPAVLPGHEASEPARARDADGATTPSRSPTSSGSPGRTCSSTRTGSTTTTARTTCSRPTSASARTSTTSRPRSRSGRGSSTTCGHRCRSWPPPATPSPV